MNSAGDYDPEHVRDLSNLTLLVSCCNDVIITNPVSRHESKIHLKVNRSVSLAFTPVTIPSFFTGQPSRADDSLESGL